MKRALIVGHSGQDGRILCDQLAEDGYALIGIGRRTFCTNEVEWNEPVDISSSAAVHRLVGALRPNQIYYLAAYHHSSQQATQGEEDSWRMSWQTHTQGLLNFLEAIRLHHPMSRLFYASSSRVFGQADSSPQNELTPLRPTCVYGATKAMGMALADYYRRNHDLFAACGILFNHESPLRGEAFVTQRVIKGLIDIKAGRSDLLQVGSLEARVDWGYAPDYTKAMRLILEADKPDDFVVATGKTYSVRELVEVASEIIGLRWESKVIENAGILNRKAQELCGDSSRLRRVTGWRPSTTFRDMIEIMITAAQHKK
jgi:GDPmannose 4,6-dehydratase